MGKEESVQLEIIRESLKLQDKYKKYVGPLKESFKLKGKQLDDIAMATVLNCLKHLDTDLRIVESTQSINVGTFIQHGYDLITSIYPNLVSNIICSTQPLASKSGEVWFYNLVYQDAKGLTSAGTGGLQAKTGARPDMHYGTEYIDQVATGTVNGSNAVFTGTIPNAPIRTNAGDDFFIITDGTELFTTSVSAISGVTATLTGDLGGTGTLNVTTGAYSVTFNTAPVTGSQILATGKVYFETTPGAIGRTKISMVSEPIFAEKHALITDYTLDSEHDLARNFNMNIADELIKGTSALIRAELDTLIMEEIRVTAKNGAISSGTSTWNGAVPSGIAQLDHFRTLLTMFKNQSNKIYDSTRMVFANFAIVGSNISTVLEILPEFKANPATGTEATASGPYVVGTVNGMTIIKNPMFNSNEWVIGNRGATAFNTGYILAPYKGLFVTGAISDVTNPFSVTRGMWMEAGRKVVNPKFYAYGRATNLTF